MIKDQFRFFQKLQDDLDSEYDGNVRLMFFDITNVENTNQNVPELEDWLEETGLEIPFLTWTKASNSGMELKTTEWEMWSEELEKFVIDGVILSPDAVKISGLENPQPVNIWGDEKYELFRAWIVENVDRH